MKTMAKVNVVYDTVDKTCSISVDGKTLENVMECSVYCDYMDGDQPKFRFMASTMKSDEDNDMHEFHMIRAALTKKQKVGLEEAIARYCVPLKV